MNTRLLISLVLFCCLQLVVNAQKQEGAFLGIMEHHSTDAVELRWFPSTVAYWQAGLEYGYDIYRMNLNSDGTPIPGNQLVKITAEPLKVDTTAIYKAVESDSSLRGAVFFLTSEAEKPGDLQSAAEMQYGLQFMYIMSGLASNMNREVAELGGLYYKDNQVKPDGAYYYEIKVHDNSDWQGAQLVVKMNEKVEAPKPYQLNLKIKGYKASLYWKNEFLNFTYAYYDIYRAVDSPNGAYTKINEFPYIGTQDEENKDSKLINFLDSVPELGHTYYYKVRGISPFGIEGPFSELVKAKAVKPLKYVPEVKSWNLDTQGRVIINWEIDPEDEEALMNCRLFRATSPINPPKAVSVKLERNMRSATDAPPELSNYYFVAAYDEAGDSVMSAPYTVIIEDSIPPQIPTGLAGQADTNGIVTVTWTPNTDEDLKGYRLYRRNEEGEDFERMVADVITDTVFIDTIDLHVGYENMRYRLHAVDNRYNISDPCEEIKVKRPDIIPPLAPVWERFVSSYDGIELFWANDPRDDLYKQTLYRRGGKDLNDRPIKVFEGETLRDTTFLDTKVESKTKYTYYFITEDKSGNKSKPGNPITLKKRFQLIKDPIEEFDGLASKENQLIKVFWTYNYNSVKYFKIYRETPQKKLTYYKSIKGSSREFYDEELRPDTDYGYVIQAIFKDGSKSKLSDLITVKY